MISFDISFDGLEKEVERVTAQVRRDVANALIAGYNRIIDHTPKQTGFLAASWYLSIDGAGHPNPPDAGLKRDLDYERPFRNVGNKQAPPPYRTIYDEKFGEFRGAQRFSYGARVGVAIDRRRFSFTRMTFAFVNDADYAEYVNQGLINASATGNTPNNNAGFVDVATAAADREIKRQLRAVTRSRRRGRRR